MNNGFYVLGVSQLLNKSSTDKNWAIMDVRPSQLYEAGHILGAISIPPADLIPQMALFPPARR